MSALGKEKTGNRSKHPTLLKKAEHQEGRLNKDKNKNY